MVGFLDKNTFSKTKLLEMKIMQGIKEHFFHTQYHGSIIYSIMLSSAVLYYKLKLKV